TVSPSSSIMHSLQALALIHEKRIASVGSLLTRTQRSPSSTDWPRSNGTSWVSQWPLALSRPRQIFSVAVSLIGWLSLGSLDDRRRRHRGESDGPAGEPCDLVDVPWLEHARKILALMGAAALAAGQRGLGDRMCDEQHIAEVEPVEPGHV